jgi:replicative DNA helicase
MSATQNADVAPKADLFLQERFDTEAELLGAILSTGDVVSYRAAAAIAGPEHFSDLFNARMFSLMGKGFDQGLYGFPLTAWILAQLRDDDTLKESGMTGSRLIARYVAQACPAIAIEGSARQIRHNSLSNELKAAVEDGDTASAENIAAEMERLSRAHLVKDENLETIAALATRTLGSLNEAYQAGAAVKDYAFCGSHDLADRISGWRRGRLYIMAGRPGMGKSTMALSLLLRTALKGHGVLMFALEMGREELTEMALCDLAWSRTGRVEYRDISASAVMRDGFAEKYATVMQASRVLSPAPFMIGDKGGLTLAQVRSQAMQYAQRLQAEGKRLDAICIDHLGLLKASGNYAGNKVAETEEISTGLKTLAKELQCAVIALAQLNRGVEGREDKRPGLSDLRWSGSIEQDADVVMFVYREAYYLEKAKHDEMIDEERRKQKLATVKHKIELHIAKQRGGPCGSLDMFCDMGCAVVRDAAP